MQVNKYQKNLYNALLHRTFIIIVVVFILGSGHEIAQGADNVPLTLLKPDSTITVISKSDEKLDLRFTLRQKTAHVDVPINKTVQNKKLNITFNYLEKVRKIHIRPLFIDGGEQINRPISIPLGKAGGIKLDYSIILPDGNYDAVQIVFGGDSILARVEISKVTLKDVSATDSVVFVYVMAIVISIYILLPGILIFPLTHHHVQNGEFFKSTFAAYSVIFYTVGYLIWIICQNLQLKDPDVVLLIYICLGIIFLAGLNFTKDGGAYLLSWLKSDGNTLVAYCMLLMCVTFLVVRGTNLPIENTWYSTIAGPKTYGAFRAHDAVFQYVNAFAISNDETFNTYYSGRRLIYSVEDREILPGVLYAGLRSVMRLFSNRTADSFLIYTIFGIGMNLLVIFPLLSFLKQYIGTINRGLFILALSLNAFVLENYYLTWFKMAGGGFFLSGLYILLNAEKIRDWTAAGMLFGIGANMHAGSALGIPFFFLWAVFDRVRHAHDSRIKSLMAPLALVIVFIFLNLPWATVKHHYFRDSTALIRTHFLNGVPDSGGLINETKAFFKKVPLSEQVPQRMKRFFDSFRLKEVKTLYLTLKTESFYNFKLLWNRYEFRFVAFSFYPLFGLLAFTIVYRLFENSVLKDSIEDMVVASPNTVARLFGLSALTIAVIIFLSYGSHKPDLNYHLPMGVTLLGISLILGSILRSKGISLMVPLAYYAFTAYRLFSVS
jgi:hypothetical protein